MKASYYKLKYCYLELINDQKTNCYTHTTQSHTNAKKCLHFIMKNDDENINIFEEEENFFH